MTKQELKHDELEDVLDQITLWYHKNARWIHWVVIALLVAFVGYRLYQRYEEVQNARATTEIGRVYSTLTSALVEQNEQKRKELYATAIADAERLAKQYGRNFHGRQALLALGNAHYYYSLALANQKTEAAEERKLARQAYEKLLAEATTPEEKAAAYLALANVLENELFATRDISLLKQATDYYREVMKLVPNSYLAAEAQLALARMYQPVSDKRNEAEQALARVAEARKLSPKQNSEHDEKDASSKPTRYKAIDPEKAEAIKNFAELSYEAEARRLLATLKGFEPAKAESK